MSATRSEISEWFDKGIGKGATHMVIVCDTFDHDDYPVYADSESSAKQKVAAPGSMQRVMEVYKLDDPKDPQLNERRCWRL
jgi:hypothetical protein